MESKRLKKTNQEIDKDEDEDEEEGKKDERRKSFQSRGRRKGRI